MTTETDTALDVAERVLAIVRDRAGTEAADAEVNVTALTVPLSSAFLRRAAPLPSEIERYA